MVKPVNKRITKEIYKNYLILSLNEIKSLAAILVTSIVGVSFYVVLLTCSIMNYYRDLNKGTDNINNT